MDSTIDSTHEGGAAPRSARARAPSLGSSLSNAWHELRELTRDHAVLAVLEAQRAGLRFAILVGIALAVAVLGVTAWLTAVTALAAWLLGNDMSWPVVLIIAALLNIVIAVVLVFVAKTQVLELPFSATLRQLSADRNQLLPGRSDGEE